ncbi:AAA family ATPase, partial [Elusimicrobiota bacterium]
LPEYPSDDGSIAKKVTIERNNLWLFTVNPVYKYSGRDRTPSSVRAHLPVFNMELDNDRIPELVKELFKKKRLEDQIKWHKKLSRMHLGVRDYIEKGLYDSPQDITRRDIIRTIDKFNEYLDENSPEVSMRKALESVYVYKWKSLKDITRGMALAEKIMGSVEGLSEEEIIDMVDEEDRNVMILRDATVTIQQVRDMIDAKIIEVPLSGLHRKRQIVGGYIPREKPSGISRFIDFLNIFKKGDFEAGLGIIPEAIAEARSDPNGKYALLLNNYTHMNSQVAPLLNEFLQEGMLNETLEMITPDRISKLIDKMPEERWHSLWDEYVNSVHGRVIPSDRSKLKTEDREDFTRWYYSAKPSNLRIVATGYTEEKTDLSPAEINRFLTVNISGRMSMGREWVEDYIEANVPEELKAMKMEDQIRTLIVEAFDMYELQESDMEYDHNRFGRSDIDAFFKILLEDHKSGLLDNSHLVKVAYYMFGSGLRPEYRNKLTYRPDPIEDPQKAAYTETRSDGKKYLVADGIEIRLEHEPEKQILADTESYVRQLASMILGIRSGRVIVLEGFPGGSKTESTKDLARRLGLEPYRRMMYEDIDLGDILGRMSRKGRELILTAREKTGGRWVLPFLRAYHEGGIYLADEGAIGENSSMLLSYLVELAGMEELDLGIFHPGLKGEKIVKSPHFHLVIAQNPAITTLGRKPIPYGIDTVSHKIWVDNRLTREDAVMIIDHHMETEYSDEKLDDIKKKLARLHNLYTRIHPHKEELSPRQLVMIASVLKEELLKKEKDRDFEKAAFKGIVTAYLGMLSEEEFMELWGSVTADDMFGKSFDMFLVQWKSSLEERKNIAKDKIRVGGIDIRRSGNDKSNVEKDQVLITESMMSQNWRLRDMLLGISLHKPIALIEEEGADALDLARKLALMTGYDLEVFWPNPQSTKMHILTTVLPKFKKQFDKYGIKPEDISDEFAMAWGFVARHLVKEEDYEKEKRKKQVSRILFFNMLDVMPERQRILLNDILAEGKVPLIDEKGKEEIYKLPEWVHIMVSSPVKHKFSSAFINRFLQLRVRPIDYYAELKDVIQNRYPDVTDNEVRWIEKVAVAVSGYDKEMALGLQYGHSRRDIMTLAREIQLEKQKDHSRKEFSTDPFHYLLKAFYIVYWQGMDRTGKEIFADSILFGENGFFNKLGFKADIEKAKSIWSEVIASADIEFGTFDRESKDDIEEYKINITRESLKKGVEYDSGISAKSYPGGITINTPAITYHVENSELKEGKKLSDGLSVIEEDGKIVLTLKLVSRIGSMELPRTDLNRAYALPESEVETSAFMHNNPLISRTSARLMKIWAPVRDNMERRILPRVALLNGETGTAKTTLIRNIARIWGVPLYMINAYEEMKVSDATVGLRVKAGEFEVGLKEFLIRCGEIRKYGEEKWERKTVKGRWTSNRSILLVDEANASEDLMWALMPLLRGEKRFTVEYAGESYEVKLDEEVMVVLTFNPAEKYSGRTMLARELASYGEKIWAPNPLRYSRPEKEAIMREYHRRGIENMEAIRDTDVVYAEREGFRNIEEKDVYEIAVDSIKGAPKAQDPADYIRSDEEDEEPEDVPEKEDEEYADRDKVPMPIEIEYDLDEIVKNASGFKPKKLKDKQARQEAYFYFAEYILKGFLKSIKGDDNNRAVKPVLAAAGRLDKRLKRALEELIDVYRMKVIPEADLKEKFFILRNIFVESDVYIFMHFASEHSRARPYLVTYPEKIDDKLSLTKDDYSLIGLDHEYFKDKDVKALLIEGENYPHIDARGYFEGEYAVVFKKTSREKIEGVEEEEVLNWVAYHELGHVIDQLRWRSDERKPIPKNIELNSMLFPVIFSGNAREYIVHELADLLYKVKEPENYYA